METASLNLLHSPPTGAIAQKLKKALHSRALSVVDLAQQTGLKRSFIYDILSGKSSNPSPAKLAQVAMALGVSLDELVGSVPEAALLARPANIASLSPRGQAESSPLSFSREWLRLSFAAEPSDMRLHTVGSDHMEPALRSGDLLLIDTRQTRAALGVFALREHGEVVVKRLEMIAKKRVRISCDNSHYSAYECSLDTLDIVGRVVWCGRAW